MHSLAALIFGHNAQPGRFSTVNNARRVGPKKSAQTKWTLGCPLGALGFILSDAHHVLVWHQRTLFILHLSIMAGWLSWANKKDSSGGGMPVELLMTLNFATRVRQVWAQMILPRSWNSQQRMQSKQNPPRKELLNGKHFCVNWYPLDIRENLSLNWLWRG